MFDLSHVAAFLLGVIGGGVIISLVVVSRERR